MANVRSEFRIGLKDETARGVASVNKSLDGLKSRAAGLAAQFANLGKFAGGGAVLGAFVAADQVRRAVDMVDSLERLRKIAGVTAESFSGLAYAAELADVSNEQLATALKTLGRNMDTAAQGGGAAAEAFARLGVGVKDGEGNLRAVDKVFADVAERLSQLPDGAEKTALAMKVLGRSGADLVPLMNEGADGLARAADEAARFGKIVSAEAAAAADEFKDNMTRLGAAAEGLSINIANKMLPSLANISTAMAEAARESGLLKAAWVGLGGVAAELFLDTPLQNLQDRATELRKEIALLDTQIRSGLTRPDNPDEMPLALNPRQLEEATARLQNLRNELGAVVREQLKLVSAPPVPPARAAAAALPTTPGKTTEKSGDDSQRVAAALKRESDDVRNFLQDYAREREESFQREVEQSRDRARALIAEFATPQEEAVAKLKEIERTLGADSETYKRAAVQLFDELNPQLDEAEEKTRALRSTFADLGATFSSAFEDAVLGGEKFSNVLEGLAEDIARLLLRKAVIDPLIEGLGSLFGGKGGSGGGGGGIGFSIGSLLGSLFSNAQGGLYKVAGSGGGERPVAFTAQPGEMVAVGRPGDGGGIVVNVIGAPSQPRVSSRSVGGRRVIDLAFADAMGNVTAQGMLAPLGINPPLVGR